MFGLESMVTLIEQETGKDYREVLRDQVGKILGDG